MAVTLLFPYCTLKEVQIETQNTEPADATDFVLAINSVSRWIDRACKRDFLFHDHHETPLRVPLSWCAGNTIYLPWPVLTLSTCTVSADGVPGEPLDAADYAFENTPLSSTGKVHRSGRWNNYDLWSHAGVVIRRVSALPRVITLTGTFGYPSRSTTAAPVGLVPGVVTVHSDEPAPDLPADIRQACVQIAAIRSGKMRKEIIDLSGSRQSVTLRTLPRECADVLDRYRIALV
jgi:hypothetical protein